MSTNEPATRKLLHDRRGVAYVEQLVMVCVGLCLAVFIAHVSQLLLAPRFQRGVNALYSGAP